MASHMISLILLSLTCMLDKSSRCNANLMNKCKVARHGILKFDQY